MRVNVNLPEQLVDLIDDFAEKNGVTRTSAIIYLLAQQINIELKKEDLDKEV